jgi:hypothetical protein
MLLRSVVRNAAAVVGELRRLVGLGLTEIRLCHACSRPELVRAAGVALSIVAPDGLRRLGRRLRPPPPWPAPASAPAPASGPARARPRPRARTSRERFPSAGFTLWWTRWWWRWLGCQPRGGCGCVCVCCLNKQVCVCIVRVFEYGRTTVRCARTERCAHRTAAVVCPAPSIITIVVIVMVVIS